MLDARLPMEGPAVKTYGDTEEAGWRRFRFVALIDCVIWAGMNIIVFSSIGFDWFMVVGSTMTAIVGLGFALPSSTSADPQIRFDGHWLEQVAGDKVVAENPVENLEKVMIGGLIFALTLKFGAGVRMSLMQIPRSECYRLAHDLRQAPGARFRVYEGWPWHEAKWWSKRMEEQ